MFPYRKKEIIIIYFKMEIKELNNDNLIKGIDGKLWLSYLRFKTNLCQQTYPEDKNSYEICSKARFCTI